MFFRFRHIILSALLTGGAFCFYACTNDLEKVRIELEGETMPSAITHDVKITYSDSGIVKFELTAPLRYDYQGEAPYSEMPEGVTIRFYNHDIQKETFLTADYALLKDKEGILLTRGNVEIKSGDGEELYTDQLTWDDKNKVIYTDEIIHIQTEGQALTGEGLWANQDFTRYRILVPEGTLNVKED